MMLVLGLVFVAACLIALLTYGLQALVFVLAGGAWLIWIVGSFIVQAVWTVGWAIGWCLWFCVQPKKAMASLKAARRG